MQNLTNFPQLISLVITFSLLRQCLALVSGSIRIFPSLAMSGIPIRRVLLISGILSDSNGISHVKLLFWLQQPCFEDILSTGVPCLCS